MAWYDEVRQANKGKKPPLAVVRQAARDYFWWCIEANGKTYDIFSIAERAGCDPDLLDTAGIAFDPDMVMQFHCLSYDGIEFQVPNKHSMLRKMDGSLIWHEGRHTYVLAGDVTEGILE